MVAQEYRCYVFPLPDTKNHWLLYLFPVDPKTGRCADPADDGMPNGPSSWRCNLQVAGTLAILRGAEDAPPEAGMAPLINKGIEMGCTWVEWHRCKNHRLIPKRFPLLRSANFIGRVRTTPPISMPSKSETQENIMPPSNQSGASEGSVLLISLGYIAVNEQNGKLETFEGAKIIGGLSSGNYREMLTAQKKLELSFAEASELTSDAESPDDKK